jgi:serine/threonine protein kinase
MVKTQKIKKRLIGFEKDKSNNIKKKGAKIDFSLLKFSKKDLIGEGAYSKVYKFRYGKGHGKINNKYVVKKIKVLFLKKFYGEFANQEIITLFNNELKALIHLSKLKISPKIYGIYSDVSNDKLYYILEKLDTTLGDMLRNKKFNPQHTGFFIDLLYKMLQTKYRHTDLHIENIMYDESRNKFFLIDFGHHKELKKENSEGFFYTENSQSEDLMLFDKTRGFENSILGTSGASAISQIYKYLVLKILKENNINAFNYLEKLKKFIRKFSSKNTYKKIINVLNNGVGVSEESKLKLTKMKVFN